MKVIDLLNKIANGEEVPEKIRYNNVIFTYCENADEIGKLYIYEEDNIFWFDRDFFNLDTEVEIIEEDKKEGFVSNNHRIVPNENGVSIFPIEEDKEIEEIKLLDEKIAYVFDGIAHCWNLTEKELVKKINELTKSLNELKKGK